MSNMEITDRDNLQDCPKQYESIIPHQAISFRVYAL